MRRSGISLRKRHQASSGGASGTDSGLPEAWFKTTHWSSVLHAADSNDPAAEASLARLCQTYWYPLYYYIRRLGHGPEDAQDMTQGFLARLVHKDYLNGVKQEKAKFRSFLLVALKRFLANEWDRANRLKRGGGKELVSFDAQDTENRFLAEPVEAMSPEKAFERCWALALLSQVLNRLEAEFCASNKALLFQELKGVLSGEETGSSYAELGQRLGMSETNVKVTVHRLRRRYRELLREEVATTVDSPEKIDDEIRHLFATLSS
ncbi:MAG TPA: sigma-70 family RNA polymerase sigma factor [Verrucomicrobiae bacterium]|nr:sigma-70 family RNA polymerase sigma factor [Verrucomicrobiae bacterium]